MGLPAQPNIRRRGGFRPGKLFIGGVALAVLSAGAGAMTVSAFEHTERGGCEATPAEAVAAVDLQGSILERAAARALPSVVKLDTDLGHRFTVGSGIILTDDGLILTSRHVLYGAGADNPDPLSATFPDGRSAPLTMVGADPDTDVAVVRAEGISGYPSITIGSSAGLRVGQRVVAIGSPLGLENSVTSGIVSALHRPIPVTVGSAGRVTVLDTIQTDAGINFGSAGGALVDSNGLLVGVNTLTAGRGMSFALPIDQAMRIAQELITAKTASHAFLGAQVTTEKQIRGAVVTATRAEGPAARAGLAPGTVITGIDGRVIADAETLVASILSKAPGDTVTATYIDVSGDHRTAAVDLASDRAWPTAPVPGGSALTSELGYATPGAKPRWSV